MITRIELQNTRIFDDKEWIFTLPKLSVFCGTNSSGKSTILKSLLLLRQSFGIDEPLGSNYGKLRFVGSQVDLGNYKSFVSHEDTNRDIYFGLTISDYFPFSFFETLSNLKYGEQSNNAITYKENVDYLLNVKLTFCSINRITETEFNPTIKSYESPSTTQTQGILKLAQFEVSVDDQVYLDWDVILDEKREDEEGKQKYYIRLPTNFFRQQYQDLIPELLGFDQPPVSKKNRRKDKTINIQVGLFDENIEGLIKDGYIVLRTFLNGLLPESLGVQVIKGGDTSQDDEKSFVRWKFPPPPLVEYLLTDLIGALGKIQYLGPLRSPARRYYLTPQDANPIMDIAGEFLPYIFKDLKQGEQYKVDYYPPRDHALKSDIPLTDALNAWMHYIRTGEPPCKEDLHEIDVEQTKVLLEFKIRSIVGEESHSLVDTGFGYSQILPILMRGLLAPRTSTVVVEQPELHLNPALQVRLVEFFISLVRLDKQVLLETHSEHIVNMIRVLIAEDESGDLANNSKIYYIDNDMGRVVVHDLTIQQDGTVPKWPRSFFGEAATLAGRLLRAQKRFRS